MWGGVVGRGGGRLLLLLLLLLLVLLLLLLLLLLLTLQREGSIQQHRLNCELTSTLNRLLKPVSLSPSCRPCPA